jgi:hypothetical protein
MIEERRKKGAAHGLKCVDLGVESGHAKVCGSA